MWHAETETIANGLRIRLEENGAPMSFGTLFGRMAAEVSFASWYTELLAGCNLVSFFWEHPPLTRSSIDTAAEFALIDAPLLTGLRADREAFRERFEAAGTAPVAVFDNLSGDARLIAPCIGEGVQNCAHLAPFVRSGPPDLICSFWRVVGSTVLDRLGEPRLWLSTSGLGVSWLHVRLDSTPKYYQFGPYKTGVCDGGTPA